MADSESGRGFLTINMDERKLSIVVFSLFFSWILAFPFEGQVLYALARRHDFDPQAMVFTLIAAHFTGLFLCGFFIKTMKTARGLMLFSSILCLLATGLSFFPPSIIWRVILVSSSFWAGGCVAAWGFYFKSGTPSNERIKTAADVLIYSNMLMIFVNMTAIHLSPYAGLGLSMFMLGGAFLFVVRLPALAQAVPEPRPGQGKKRAHVAKPLVFLCLFIVIITFNSGLMYQVLNPAYAHHQWLVSWYWAVPYIVVLYVMKNLPGRTNRSYILYIAIAMIGFSFISFMTFDRSAASYLLVNTLMLGACGVYDLFWWSILGEMLDLDKNPAKILGAGLSANVLGVLLGGLTGSFITAAEIPGHNSSALALAVVCVTLAILPPLHKHLSSLLENHAYLTAVEMPSSGQNGAKENFTLDGRLTDRENEIAALLFKGKTYRMIAGELHLSENTVKTHVKNIYAKLNVGSKMELANMMLEKGRLNPH